jgi:endonuclease YncB( thermonuclease family)
MKKSMITLACAMIAPIAFAQTTTTTEQTTTSAPEVSTTTTTAPVASTSTTETTTTYTDGTVSTFTPGKTIVVRREGVTDPISYTLGKTVRYVTRTGKEIKENMIRPGARVKVYYSGPENTRVVERVVVDQD